MFMAKGMGFPGLAGGRWMSIRFMGSHIGAAGA